VIKTIESIIFTEKNFLDHILGIYHNLNQTQKAKLSIVLAPRIDYIILKLANQNNQLLEEIITIIFSQKIIEPIIDFLNKNSTEEIENLVLNMVKLNLSEDLELTREFRAYVKPEILAKIGLNALALETEAKEKSPVEKKKIIWIVKWIIFAVLLFPIIYLVSIAKDISKLNIGEILQGFVINVNIYLIYYFVTINIIYLILLVLALKGSREQVELAKTKKYSLLFSDSLLPGISIIAPAYNEEISIIDSVTSLLNLKYPNYEVIVVNDGSKDETLNKLIEHFELERKHFSYNDSLATKKVRGIYICKNIPNLVVVDKNNGGKADALNVGINVSAKTFVCGIDADSILESDSLLKLASAMLDDTTPHLAMGGNIYPANGFTFNRGQVETYGIPKEILCRLQTIEYLRAFTSGRIGWSKLRSLMIISGAFGLFHKDTLIRIGGYLTISGSLKKDTVGEDMELVVRLTRDALERKEPLRVVYIYNAYCYTELPSDLKTLSKQRNRWQRGLIDILSYHRKLALKPKFKQIGFIGYPYFFIFEFLGPFFEMFGYLMLIVALALNLLNLEIILAIFTASIGFGIVISLFSLLMSEREIKLMSAKETFILLLYAFIENFGYRQFISLHRVFSSFSALKESGQWGVQKRKGFKK
jgi:cellulose synthase/poly-beta-1,6-N-acetylglucosamine synthase-like glycosyltransferase